MCVCVFLHFRYKSHHYRKAYGTVQTKQFKYNLINFACNPRGRAGVAQPVWDIWLDPVSKSQTKPKRSRKAWWAGRSAGTQEFIEVWDDWFQYQSSLQQARFKPSGPAGERKIRWQFSPSFPRVTRPFGCSEQRAPRGFVSGWLDKKPALRVEDSGLIKIGKQVPPWGHPGVLKPFSPPGSSWVIWQS